MVTTEKFPESLYPLSLAGCHGRISALNDALARAYDALGDAVPYVNGVYIDHNNGPWRRETAETTLAAVRGARDRIEAELRA